MQIWHRNGETMRYRIQRVCEEDRDLLFEWVNDEMCRKNSFHSHKVSYKEHCEWFEKKINDPMCYMFIYYYGEKPIGQIRIDCENDIGYIDYFVICKYRGQGHGGNMLRLVEQEMYGILKKLVSYVKTDNIASQYAFKKNDYIEEKEHDFLKFQKIISDNENAITKFVSGGNSSYK